MEKNLSKSYVLILYTTQYRLGGEKFELAAIELATVKRTEFPNSHVIRKSVESKTAFIQALKEVEYADGTISELHFIGHSGMYGIMFGTTAWPEQLSPYEWRNLDIKFAKGSDGKNDAKAFFHACRTGRWFAPFFSRTFQVRAYGYFFYTTVSRRADRFSWEGLSTQKKPVYIISVPGKKSHGVLGSMQKYVLRPKSYPMLEFLPPVKTAGKLLNGSGKLKENDLRESVTSEFQSGNRSENNFEFEQKNRADAQSEIQSEVDTTYNSVAELYDQTFEDISVRKDELSWLRHQLQERNASLPSKCELLDIGCGTGSFLRAIEDLVHQATGVDLSAGMIEHASRRSATNGKLKFKTIQGPHLPFPDNSFDVVTSVLSFRYLDWDPIMNEILRVLKPGGRILIIDMVAAPVRFCELPMFIRDKSKQQMTELRFPEYRKALRRMVGDARWKRMLEYNPIRAEHEMKWYLQSRFPGGNLRVINYGRQSRVMAFASPPVFQKTIERLSYP